MTPSEALINTFLSSPDAQRWVASALDYCARLSAAVAETHGFHEDEHKVLDLLAVAWEHSPHIPHEELARLRQWTEDQFLQAEQARVMSETAEGVENVRKGRGPDDKCPEFPGFAVEAIDDMIRNLDLLGKRGISPGEIFVAKTLINISRPHKHGKNS
jgi:hypothetical protein